MRSRRHVGCLVSVRTQRSKSFRRTIVLALSLLVTSSLALAQEASTDSVGAPKKSDTNKKTEATKKTETSKKKASEKGKKVEHKDSDLDTTVGEATTTAAEQPPRDVAEGRAEEKHLVLGNRWSAAPLVGYGTGDMKVGLGARAGYTFDTPIYVGGTFLYHFGTGSVANAGGLSTSERTFYYPAVEAGYDLAVGPVLVRPYGGLGVLFAKTTLTAGGAEASATDKQLMVYPGVTGQYLIPHSAVFVGADARVLLPVEGENASFSLFATAGLSM